MPNLRTTNNRARRRLRSITPLGLNVTDVNTVMRMNRRLRHRRPHRLATVLITSAGNVDHMITDEDRNEATRQMTLHGKYITFG